MIDKGIEVAAGERVGGFLKDEAVQAAFGKLREQYRSELEDGPTAEAREIAWHRLKVLKDVLSQLEVVVGDGQMAQAALKAEARRSPIIP